MIEYECHLCGQNVNDEVVEVRHGKSNNHIERHFCEPCLENFGLI